MKEEVICPICKKSMMFFSVSIVDNKLVNKPTWCMNCGADYKEERNEKD